MNTVGPYGPSGGERVKSTNNFLISCLFSITAFLLSSQVSRIEQDDNEVNKRELTFPTRHGTMGPEA